MNKTITTIAILALAFTWANCGGGGEEEEGGGEEEEGGGGATTTISGTLSVTSAALNVALAPSKSLKASDVTDCTGYKAHLVNLDDKTEEIVNINADCSFSKEVDAGETYAVNFLDNNYKFIGSLIPDQDVSKVETGDVDVGLKTLTTDTTSLGTVTLSTTEHTAAGSEITPEMADTRFVAAAQDGIPVGLLEGNGNTDAVNDKDHSTTKPDTGVADDATDPDADNDGVLDVVDSDNNNNGIKDDIEGVGSSGADGGGCIPLDRMTLFTNNKVPATTIINGTYSTADAYVVTIHMHPRSGYTVNSITVSGPEYLSKVHATFGSADDFAGSGLTVPEEQWGWDGTLEWNPGAEIGSYTAWIGGVTESEATNRGIEALNLGTIMAEGDVYIFTVTTDSATYTCTKKINGVFREVPKSVSINTKPDTDVTNANWTSVDVVTNGVTFTWSIDDLVNADWSGLEYNIEFWGLDNNCQVVEGASDFYPSDRNSDTDCRSSPSLNEIDQEEYTIPAKCLPGYSEEGVTIWQFDISASSNNNSAYQGGKFTTQDNFPEGC